MISGSVDITSLDTKSNPEEPVEYLKQQTVISARNIFSTAENALASHPGLKKVVVMNQTPRYDEKSVDPLSLKPVLALLFNNTLTELWTGSKFRAKVVIGAHSLDCSGGVKEARYRDIKYKKYDGLHLYGPSGRKAYTVSVLNIFKSAGIAEQINGQTVSEYYKGMLRFLHQKRKHTNQHKTTRLQPDSANDKDVRQNKQTDGQHNNSQRYSVPTYNLFDHLNY